MYAATTNIHLFFLLDPFSASAFGFLSALGLVLPKSAEIENGNKNAKMIHLAVYVII